MANIVATPSNRNGMRLFHLAGSEPRSEIPLGHLPIDIHQSPVCPLGHGSHPMDLKLNGRVALVCGSSSGLGLAIATAGRTNKSIAFYISARVAVRHIQPFTVRDNLLSHLPLGRIR